MTEILIQLAIDKLKNHRKNLIEELCQLGDINLILKTTEKIDDVEKKIYKLKKLKNEEDFEN